MPLSLTEPDLPASQPTNLYIAGSWTESASGSRFPVKNPATGATLAQVADAGPQDGKSALDAAAAAQEEWAGTPPQQRSEILRAAFEALRDNADDFALLMTLEMGKPLAESRGEVTYGAEFLRWFAGEATRVSGRYMTAPDGRSRLLVHQRPVGPCLFITPWNFPLAMATRKVGAAIAAGCTMVLKPAELTPLTALRFAQLLADCGLPGGVLNVVTTTHAAEISAPLMEDDRLRKVSFTGSTAVGRLLLKQSAGHVLRTSMELGGNAPFLVFPDADLDQAVAGAMTAKLRNMGEACTSANRFLVHRDVVGDFTARLSGAMSELQVGNGIEPDTDIGPLIDQRSRDSVHSLVCDALERGADLILGGVVPDGPGCFYPPTILTNVPPAARLLHEEIFGPVSPILTFATEAEAVTLANDTEYGLVAYAYTNDLSRSIRLSEQLQAGMLGINTGIVSNPAAPFGGVKESGLGREGGAEGIAEYLETRYVAIAGPNLS